jgi:hypothetical protein
VSFRIQRGQDDFVRPSVRHVVNALSPLVLHYVALKVDLGEIHGRQEKSHPVRIEPQRQLQRIRGQDLVVVGAVFRSRPVIVGTSRFEKLVERTDRNVLRAHEHYVLEQVGKSGSAYLLVARPDVIPCVNRDDRGRVILVENDLETVRELVLLELDTRGGLCIGARSRQRAED